MNGEERLKIGQRLRKYREEKGFSQRELAEGICTNTSISEMERGTFVLSEEKLQKICDRLDIQIEDLIITHRREVPHDIVMGVIRIQIARRGYQAAYKIIEELEQESGLEERAQHLVTLYRAECLIKMGRADEAITFLINLQQVLEQPKEQNLHLLAELYDKLGVAYCISRQPNIVKGYAHSWRAYKLSLSFPIIDELAAKIAYNLGKICNRMGDAIDAKAFFQIAQEFFEKTSSLERLASVLFEQGIAYQRLNEFDQAERCLNESYAIYKSQNTIGMAQRVRRTIADLILSRTHPQLAVEELIACAEMFRNLGDLPRVAYTHGTIASVYLEQGQFSEAERYLQRALEFISNSSTLLDPRHAYIYRIYAQYLLKIEKLDESEEYSFKSANLYDKMGLSREAADSLDLCISALRKMGKLEQALDTAERSSKLLRGAPENIIQRGFI